MRLIDANALLNRMQKDPLFDLVERYGVSGVINAEPTVDAVPVRHGKWTRENDYGIWKCSECGCKINRKYPLKGNIWNYYYCPNCGAKMDAERKEE